MPKIFLGTPLPKSFVPNKLSDMVCRVLECAGVPKNVMSEYAEESCTHWEKRLEHACLVGLTDPLSSIPANTVFVTGFQNAPIKETVVVTRFPCTEASDVRVCRF